MKKIIILLTLTISVFVNAQVTVDALDFQGKMSTTLRNALVISSGGSVLIWNLDTQQYEYAADDGVWKTLGLTLSQTTKLSHIAVSKAVDLDVLESTVNNKQDALQNGVNLKTVNGNNLLGSGDVVISSGSADFTKQGTTANNQVMLGAGDGVIKGGDLTYANNVLENTSTEIFKLKSNKDNSSVGNIFEFESLFYNSNTPLRFAFDNAGQFHVNRPDLRFVLSGGQAGSLTNAGWRNKSANQFSWSADSNPAGSPDTGLKRGSAGLVSATDGSTGVGSFEAAAYKVAGETDASKLLTGNGDLVPISSLTGADGLGTNGNKGLFTVSNSGNTATLNNFQINPLHLASNSIGAGTDGWVYTYQHAINSFLLVPPSNLIEDASITEAKLDAALLGKVNKTGYLKRTDSNNTFNDGYYEYKFNNNRIAGSAGTEVVNLLRVSADDVKFRGADGNFVSLKNSGSANLTGFHSNLEITTNLTLAYSNQVSGSGYRVDNLLKSGNSEITVSNLRTETNENYKISSVGGTADIIADEDVNFVGLNKGNNDAIRIPQWGGISLFETDENGVFKVSGIYEWYTASSGNLYQENDAADPVNEFNTISSNWISASLQTASINTTLSTSGSFSLSFSDEVGEGGTNFGRYRYNLTGLTAGNVNVKLDANQLTGLSGVIEFRDGLDGTVINTLGNNSGFTNNATWQNIDVNVTITGTELEIRFYPSYNADSANELLIDNIVITQ